MLQAPCRVDPDAVVAWTGSSPKVKTDISWKTFLGQTSGESYMFEFTEPGQIVIIQPFERQSEIKLGIDDNRYQPGTQAPAMGNTMSNLGGMLGGHGGQQGSQGGQSAGGQGGIGGIVGNILNNFK